jgi:hypothetical protein
MTTATLIARLVCAWILITVAWLIYGTAVMKLREMREERADVRAREAAEKSEWLRTTRSPESDRAVVARAHAQWNRKVRP